jgi:hypothetical protein
LQYGNKKISATSGHKRSELVSDFI